MHKEDVNALQGLPDMTVENQKEMQPDRESEPTSPFVRPDRVCLVGSYSSDEVRLHMDSCTPTRVYSRH